MFAEPFMQRALAAALLLGPLCALLGVFVTARRMAFFSDTISHAGLVGVALGFWLGLTNLTLPLVAVSLTIAAAIFWLRENTELLTDTIMALLLSGSVAAGIIIMSLLKTPPRDIHGFLFGDILAVGWQEVILAAVLAAVVAVGAFSKLNEFGLITVQEELAQVSGVPVRRLNYIFVIGLTFAVALSIRLLGIVLVTALLVIPAAAARNVSRNLRQHIVWSLLLGFAGGFAGTVLSYQMNLPTGPTIVLVCIVLFTATLLPRLLRPTMATGTP
jgi:ABC-type Mn2+/Zn2+ transport system permease subunit